MNVLFLTAPSNDCDNHVNAFRSFAPAEHLVMHYRGIGVDDQVIRTVREIAPDLIFYISANLGPYALKINTLAHLKAIAPIINLCSDAADRPWHCVLNAYAKHHCFNLQVSLDGGRHPSLGLSTLTPVDPSLYNHAQPVRDIRCGFSGGVGPTGKRTEIIHAIEWFGGLTTRSRAQIGGYEDHVKFIRRCQLLLNTSWTGSGQAFHIKGRVLEAGWAGCALLEMAGSPIAEWFPKDCYFIWGDPREAADIIRDATDGEIRHRAGRLADEVRSRFSARGIYTEILSLVDSPQP